MWTRYIQAKGRSETKKGRSRFKCQPNTEIQAPARRLLSTRYNEVRNYFMNLRTVPETYFFPLLFPFSRSENLSAISGPSLPSGPYMPYNPDDEPLYKSSPSGSEGEDESTLSYSSVSKSYSESMPQLQPQVIKPKERLGQLFQPKTIQNKNSLMDIGSHKSEPKSESSNYGNFQLSRSDTMRGIQNIEDETVSTAPTVLAGFELETRLQEVRPPAHIPGKRRAPKPPPPVPQEVKVST